MLSINKKNKNQSVYGKPRWLMGLFVIFLFIVWQNDVVHAVEPNCTYQFPTCIDQMSGETTIYGPVANYTIASFNCGAITPNLIPDQVASRDIVFLIDISASMEKNDFPAIEELPQRASIPLDIIHQLANQNADDRVGVVLFSGKSASWPDGNQPGNVYPLISVPYAEEISNFIRTKVYQTAGSSDYLWAFAQAKKLLQNASNPTIILLSDGGVSAPLSNESGQLETLRTQVFCRNSQTGEERQIEFGEGIDFDLEKQMLGCQTLNSSGNTNQWQEIRQTEAKLATQTATDKLLKTLSQPWFQSVEIITVLINNVSTTTDPKWQTAENEDRFAADPVLLQKLAHSPSGQTNNYFVSTARQPLLARLEQKGANQTTGLTLKTAVREIYGEIENSDQVIAFKGIGLIEGSNPLSIEANKNGVVAERFPFSISFVPTESSTLYSSNLECNVANLSAQSNLTRLNSGAQGRIQGGAAGCSSISQVSNVKQGFKAMIIYMLLSLPMLGFLLRRRKKMGVTVLFFTLALFSIEPKLLAADDFGLNIQNFQPATDGSAISLIQTNHVLVPGEVNTSFFHQYMHDPIELVLFEQGKWQRSKFTDHLYSTHLQVGYGIFSSLSMGISMPLYLYQDYFARRGGLVWDYTSYFGVGDMLVESKTVLYRNQQVGLTLGLNPFVTIPTGNSSRLIGEDQLTYGFLFIGGQEITHKMAVAGNIGGKFRNNTVHIFDDRAELALKLRHQVLFGLGLSYLDFLTPALDISWGIKGTAAKLTGLYGMDETSVLESGIDVRYVPFRNLSISSGVSRGLGIGIGSHEFRVWSGIEYKFSVAGQKKIWTLLSEN